MGFYGYRHCCRPSLVDNIVNDNPLPNNTTTVNSQVQQIDKEQLNTLTRGGLQENLQLNALPRGGLQENALTRGELQKNALTTG